MAKLRVTGKRYTRNGMIGISLIVIAVVAVISLAIGIVILPKYAQVEDYKAPEVIGITIPDDSMISVNADLSTVYAVVRYDNGETKKVPISELVYKGLDVSKEGLCKDVILDYGGFTQKVDFNVVPTQLVVEYVAGVGGRIDGSTTQKVTAGSHADAVRAIADEGYYFYEWSDGDPNASRTDRYISKSMKLTAVFKKQSYMVVFYYPDGTTAREEIVLYNEAPTRSPRVDEREMVLYGYKFVEWDTDYSHITQDTNIHPIYEKYATDFRLDITTDVTGAPLGAPSGDTEILDYYQKLQEATIRIMPMSEQRIFVGWEILDADGKWSKLAPELASGKVILVGNGQAVAFKSTRTGNSNEYVLSFTPPEEGVEEIRARANFVFKESKIKLMSTHGNIGDIASSNEITVPYGKPIGSAVNVEDVTSLTAEGYTFKGWYIEGGAVGPDGTPVFIKNDQTFEQDATIVAYWEKNINTVVFLKGDNEDVSFTDTLYGYSSEYGGRVVKVKYMDKLSDSVLYDYPSHIPYKENYTFKGWFLADEYHMPTSRVVDHEFVVDKSVVYVVPVFEVNTKKLNVSVSGSGTAYRVDELIDDSGTIYEKETSISSVTEMPVTEDFVLRFRPGAGYSLVSATVNGVTSIGSLASADGYYDVLIGAVITQDYEVVAEFSRDLYGITINNGTESKSGSIDYRAIGSSDGKQISVANSTVEVEHGTGLYVEITPPENNRVASVTVNGVPNKDIPVDARYYSFTIDNIVQNYIVTITYDLIKYSVTLPEDGRMTAETIEAESRYESGSTPSFTIKADEGKIIKRVRANGVVIDPWQKKTSDDSQIKYRVSGNKSYVKGRLIASEEGDYRISEMGIEIVKIDRDTIFEVEYDDMYYKITTDYENVGTVTKSFNVSYGKSATIVAETSDGYYIASYTVTSKDSDGNVDEQTVVPAQANTSFSYGLDNVKADYHVRFVFRKATYYVTFNSNGDDVTVTDGKDAVNAREYTYANIEGGSRVTFTVKAREGYRLSKVDVRSVRGGTTVTEPIGYETIEYKLTINNINDDYQVEVGAEPIFLDYTVYFLNNGAISKTVNSDDVGGETAIVSGTVVYGTPFSVTVVPDIGYSVELASSFIVKPKDVTSTYGYVIFEGDYVDTTEYGQFTLIKPGDSGEPYELVVRGVRTAIDVYVYMIPTQSAEESYTVTVGQYGNGRLDTSDVTVNAGGSVTLTASPDSGYSLESIVVNGNIKTPDASGKCEITNVSSNIYAYAVFGKTTYTVRAVNAVNGMISLEKTLATYDDSVRIKLTPALGYTVNSFKIVIGDNEINPPYAQNSVVEYTIPSGTIDGNVMVEATFTERTYTYRTTFVGVGEVSGLGDTGEANLKYGILSGIEITAAKGHYIAEIMVNGSTYEPTALMSRTVDTDGSNNILAGILNLFVSEDTEVKVTFKPKTYSVSVAETLGGTTFVRKGEGAFVDANGLNLSAGDTVKAKLTAIEGYHIGQVYVNDVENVEWLEGGININSISEAVITITENVQGNIVLRVTYMPNEYRIKVNVSNTSLNFARYDTAPTSYGTVSIVGYTADENNVYQGFSHGSSVKLVIAPRVAKGYYISRYELVYTSPTTGETKTENRLVHVDKNGGSDIINNLAYDIDAVNIEFKRRSFTYAQTVTVNQKDSPFGCEGKNSTGVTFVNPYNVNAPILLENGAYEYGLTYRINVDPKAGYSRTVFEINGEDRSKAIRSTNYYTGTLTSDIAMAVTYEINVYAVSVRDNGGGECSVMTDSGEVLSDVGRFVTNSGTVWVADDGGAVKITATHGTLLRFTAKPFNANTGHDDYGNRIGAYYVNNVARPIADDNDVNVEDISVIAETKIDVTFETNYYRISCESFNGGMAVLSANSVRWNGTATLTLAVNEGYELTSVIINDIDSNTIGSVAATAFAELKESGVCTIEGIKENVAIVLCVETKRYKLTFEGEYNVVKRIVRDGELVKSLQAVSGVLVNQNVPTKTPWSAFTSDDLATINSSGELIEAIRYGDKLTLRLTAPNGYHIGRIAITMENAREQKVVVVNNASQLDADDGTGTRTFTMMSVSGNVNVDIEYIINSYTITYNNNEGSGGRFESVSVQTISHHELIVFRMLSDYGYYLKSFAINGREVPVTYSKNPDKVSYLYSTGELEVNDALVNGKQGKLDVVPIYERQSYNVLFYVNSMPITGGYIDPHLSVEIANNRIIYDGEVPTSIKVGLDQGYSVTSVVLYSVPINQANYETQVTLLEGNAEYNTYARKTDEIKLKLDETILKILDFHSTAKNTLRIYVSYQIDVFVSNTSMYLVEAEAGQNVGQSVNNAPQVVGREAFAVTAKYSDGVAGANAVHAYGTTATLTASIDAVAADKYCFEGYQENVGGVWTYVTDGADGISLLSGGNVLSYSVTKERTFRAVFFRVYTVTLRINPEYKHIRGSFASGDPNAMIYRRYAIMSATVTYSENTVNNVILPNILGVTERLTDVDGNDSDAIYTYRVKSGGKLTLSYNDVYRMTNPTNGCTYKYEIVNSAGKVSYTDAPYATGVETLEDRNVQAYLKNTLYVSFLMETVGSLSSNEGGTVEYVVNGAVVNTLKENSLTVNSGDSVKMIVKPKDNFRFDSVMELAPMPTPDESGYRRFNTVYTPLEETADGSVVIKYYQGLTGDAEIADISSYTGRIGRVEVTLPRISENSIFKVRFWKRVTLRRSISCVTDEAIEGDPLPEYVLSYYDYNPHDEANPGTTPEGQYDYGDKVNFAINSGFSGSDWYRYYQFVGYFVNGVNSYGQLAQNYPSNDYYNNYEQSFTLDNLSGLADGVNIEEKTTIINGKSVTEYIVNVVAKFIPVYNVVVENQYYDSGNYLDPGQVTVSAVMYDSSLPTYYVNSRIAEPRLSQEASAATDVSFTMLGKLNSIEQSDKTSATSAYNVWSDNLVTLNWSGTPGSGYKFVEWEYYAYDKDAHTFEWRKIPYVDPISQTNLVTKPTFCFPISVLFATTYMAYVNDSGLVSDNFLFEASTYDFSGVRNGSILMPAIRLRPVYQKVERLTLVQSVATDDHNLFNDGIGYIEPRIAGTGLREGEFDYYTIQTLLPSTTDDFAFSGWYIGENGAGGITHLNVVATAGDHDLSVVRGSITYYFKSVPILDSAGNEIGNIHCTYDNSTGNLTVLMDGTYKIFARYTSIYTLNFRVANESGYSTLLNESLPTLIVYLYNEANNSWDEIVEYRGKRAVTINGVPVGTKYKLMLSTGFREELNDPTYFNPVFDRWVGIESVNDIGADVWYTDLSNNGTHIPEGLTTAIDGDISLSVAKEYVRKVESVSAVIGATDNKDVTFKFRTYGRLEFHNVYPNASLRLPIVLAKALYGETYNSGVVYYAQDGGEADADGATNGVIIIKDIPITETVTYNAADSSDYAIRLIDGMQTMTNGNPNLGINFDGATVSSKVQNVVYYGKAEYTTYTWENDALVETSHTVTSVIDYPFAKNGDKLGNGTEDNPFYIANIEHLRNLESMYVGNGGSLVYNTSDHVHFMQVEDIDLGGLDAPLCAVGNGFDGVYNGNSKTLYNLNLSLSTDYAGLFAQISNGEVKNLYIGTSYINTVGAYAGVLAGAIKSSKIEDVIFSDRGTLTNYVRGKDYVGALAGYVDGETTVKRVNVSSYSVTASVGASFIEATKGYEGGAGGIVGALGSKASLTDCTATNVTVIATYGAGGIVGTVCSASAELEAVSDCTATNVNLSATNNSAAIGGIAGSVGKNRVIARSKLVVTKDMTFNAKSYYGRLIIDNANMYTFGAGGVVGYNAGKLSNCSTSSQNKTYRLAMRGSVSGGVVGVNVGLVEDCGIESRLYMDRAKGNSFESGYYGGIVGYNVGTVRNGYLNALGNENVGDDYDVSTATIEVVTLGKGGIEYYTPTAGSNAPMHETVSYDNSAIYVGGVVGYNNNGTVKDFEYKAITKMLVNRRSNIAQVNIAYMGAVAGYSTGGEVSSSKAGRAVYCRYFHYMYVDLPNNAGPAETMLSMGKVCGNGGGTANLDVTCKAEYVGGGTAYNEKNKELFKWGSKHADGYNSGQAHVDFYNLGDNKRDAWSYVEKDWNEDDAIEKGQKSGRVYGNETDCEGFEANLFTTIWNYRGYLRYVNITKSIH